MFGGGGWLLHGPSTTLRDRHAGIDLVSVYVKMLAFTDPESSSG